MAAPEAEIETALFTRAASLVLTPAMAMSWPNVSFTPPTSRKYIEVTHLPNTTDRFGVNSEGSHFHQGILQMVVHWPLNAGETAAKEVAGLIANHFPADFPLGAGVKVEKRPDVASKLTTSTDIQIPVSIRYRGARK